MLDKKIPVSEKKKRNSLILLLIFLVYYIIAGIAFVQFQKNDIFFHFPQVDEKTNLERAEAIVSGQLSKELFWQEPGSFLYFSLLKVVGIDSPLKIKIFQLFLLNPFIILMVYLLGRLLTGNNQKYALAAATLYAFSPLPIFLSLTIMKTVFTIFLYVICFFFYFKFFRDRENLKYGLLFVIAWFVSWWTRQHILLLLPIFFIFLSKSLDSASFPREAGLTEVFGGVKGGAFSKKPPLPPEASNKNVLLVSILIIILIVSSLSFVSIANKKQMLTLTTNGAVNFYIANNLKHEETLNTWPGPRWRLLTYRVDHLVDPYGMVKKHPLKWLALLGKKSLREFTPYADFRQFYWGYYQKIFPYFRINLILNLILMPLVLFAFVLWRRLAAPYRILLLCWVIYHAVNVFVIPGIARYNAIILPVTVLLAAEVFRLLRAGWSARAAQPEKINKKLLLLLPVLVVLLVFIKNPNDFKAEYLDYLTNIKKLENNEKTEIFIPHKSKHLIEWKYLKARCEYYQKGNYREVIALIDSVKYFARYSSDFCELLDFAYMRLGLYFDALSAHQTVRVENYSAGRVRSIQSAIVSKTEEMVKSYRREKLLTPRKANDIALYLATLPPPDTKETAGRFQELLLIAEGLAQAAAAKAQPREKRAYLDTLGIVYARRGLREKSVEIFKQVYELIENPLEKEKYRGERRLTL
ncbi:MAG: glycosyltransferase family 39 protein [Candidatus Aminicenantes bacterium]|nr:glycosyltransferase family 39 protein [Candidatus Aminicenantes bacterium]